MDPEDLEPQRPRPQPKNLDDMGVQELEAYVAELEAEVARVRAKIKAKQDYRSGVEGLFKR